MSSIEIRKISITKLNTDAVVNAANCGLLKGGGVCGHIFHDAGSAEMTKACNRIGHCDEGVAIITPGFQLPAKYVIHAVGPRWIDGEHNEPKLLYSAYKHSLHLAKENKLHSIAFPLISAGIFGYPVDKAWKQAIQACKDFIDTNQDYAIQVVFAVLDDQIKATGESLLREVAEEEFSEGRTLLISDEIKNKAYQWCHKYEMLFRVILAEEDLRESLRKYSVYTRSEEHLELCRILYRCTSQAYKYGVVIKNYLQIIEKTKISEKNLLSPTEKWADTLTQDQILACIAWHFRRDHFVEGSWISDSVANGYMLVLVHAYLRKWK